MDEGLVKKIEEGLKKFKGIQNIKITHKQFEPAYGEIPCIEFDLVSKNYEIKSFGAYKLVSKFIKKKIKDLTIVYNTPYVYNTPEQTEPLHRIIRIYIKNRTEEEKKQVEEQIGIEINNLLGKYLR